MMNKGTQKPDLEITPGPNKPEVIPVTPDMPETPPPPTHPEPPTQPEPMAPDIK